MTDKLALIEKIRSILRERYDDPATQIIKEGEALVAIGKALKGLGLHEARAVMAAVAGLEAA